MVYHDQTVSLIKVPLKMKRLDPINFENLAEKIRSVFEPSELEVMAYETGFIKRKPKKNNTERVFAAHDHRAIARAFYVL